MSPVCRGLCERTDSFYLISDFDQETSKIEGEQERTALASDFGRVRDREAGPPPP